MVAGNTSDVNVEQQLLSESAAGNGPHMALSWMFLSQMSLSQMSLCLMSLAPMSLSLMSLSPMSLSLMSLSVRLV
jgi:hypothetical protein